MTLGLKGEDWPYQDSIDAAKSFGNDMQDADVMTLVHDEVNKIVSVPAYMYGKAKPNQIFDGVTAMVEMVRDNIK
jgi:enhancing lycopene biosynthesis protein 2